MANPNVKSIYLPLARQHVRAGARWAHEVGTDYWLHPTSGLDQAAAASTATGDELAENGWVATSLVNTAGSAADFRGGVFTRAAGRTRDGSFVDTGTPSHFLTNATADLLRSPYMFGNADDMEAAAELAGQGSLPNILGVSFWGSMSVHSAAELNSAWGFINAAGSPATSADYLAGIYTDITNFALQSAGVIVGAVGPADDALWHKFRIEIDFRGKITWWVDGANMRETVVAIPADVFPVAFGFHALTTNRPLLGLTHVYYDWGS